jgi:UDP-3-O-[3-hydroxymyristoyl] glucosamine N-acyltransferase
MKIRASALLAAFSDSGLLQEMTGNDVLVERVSAAEECGPGDLVFVDREEFVQTPIERGASAIITTPKLAPAFEEAAVLTTPNVKLARALVMQRYFDRDLRPDGVERIHGSAIVAESATVAETARIGARAVVQAGARIGENCVVMANAVIEERADLGDGSVVHPCAVIGFECEIGRDVIVMSGTVIGSEGFGFAQDEQRRSHRIPQLGKVVIEDRVVVGANCCIDRGTHGATRIGAGTCIDNLCHIAHNVDVGEDCILTAMLCVAGSTRLGKRVITSGQVGIIDHLDIADDVVLVQRAGVANHIKEPGQYAGIPLMPLRDHMKSQAGIRRLPKMRDTLKELEQRVAALESG